ncbi:hypothetical protein V2J09_000291 [Rumex salicifolius]
MEAATEPQENGSTTTLPHSPASNLPSETPDPSITTTSTIGDATANPTPPLATEAPAPAAEKWPGWPGHCVFRLIVPVAKVGSIIGRKGELIKKLCEETRARIRVLDGAVGTPDRVVRKEEPEASLSPAMDAAIRVFKRVNGLTENGAEGDLSGAEGSAFCSTKLVIASSQAMNLIGKQGSMIKSIQESSGASVRVQPGDEMLSSTAPDEKIVELQGEALKVSKALEAVIQQLRKFLVDPTIVPLFEKAQNSTIQQDRQVDAWHDKSFISSVSQTGSSTEYPLLKSEPLLLDRERHLESRLAPPPFSVYNQESGLSSLRPLGLGRTGAPIVTQVAQTMQIPLSYAEDIIGTAGSNIAFIRRSSGATITVQESRGYPDEITVEIKGTALQVQAAQQLMQEFINNHKEQFSNSYEKLDAGYRTAYGHSGAYPSSSLPPTQEPYGGYNASAGGHGGGGGGGYGSTNVRHEESNSYEDFKNNQKRSLLEDEEFVKSINGEGNMVNSDPKSAAVGRIFISNSWRENNNTK